MESRCLKTNVHRGVVVFACSCLFGVGAAGGGEGEYLGPIDVVVSPDQAWLYVVEADAKRIDVLSAESRKIVRNVPCPSVPTGLAVSPDGGKLFVTCGGPNGTVVVFEAATGQPISTIAVGHSPCGPALLPDGKRLFVCNRFNDDVSVVDVESGKETGRVAVLREPVASAATPDGAFVVVANLLSVNASTADDVAAEVSIINTADLTTSSVRLPNGSASVRDVCVSPDGKYAYAVHLLSRYRMPTTQLERGWMNTNAMSVIDVAGKSLVNTVLLDEIDLGAANPWAVGTSADGGLIFVTHAGTHELSVIDSKGLMEKLRSIPKTYEEAKAQGRVDTHGLYSSTTVADVPNDLAFLVDLRRRIRLQRRWFPGPTTETPPMINSPRGFGVIGSKVYIAVYFSDMIAMVDLEDKSYHPVTAVRLAPEPVLTIHRRGEMFFHDADLCFQQWQSCASCHPDARVDGLNWDLLNDGIGNPKNTRSMLLSHKTPPAMTAGVRESAEEAVRMGIRHIQFLVRPEEDAVAIDEYLKTLEAVPSPYLVNGELSDAAKRGKELYFSERVGCATCHPEPLYTDMASRDVGSRGPYDDRGEVDTSTVLESWRTAPYMHDGRYATMIEVFRDGKHGLETVELSEQEMKDLVEFVLSL